MSLQIIIPTPLRRITANLDTVEIEAETINEAIDRLDARFPGFRSRVCDDSGELRRFINIYVNGEDVRFLDNLATRIPDGAELSIVPAIAGG
jgi:sulfur-carrier protein